MVSEELLTQHIKGILESIKEDREKLEDTVTQAERKGDLLMAFFAKQDKYPEFEKPQEFRDALTGLSEQIGHALFIVLEIENKRTGIPKASEEKEKTTQESPSVVVTSPPPVVQAPSSFWGGYMGIRVQTKAQKDIQKMIMEKEREKPKITTEQQVTDVLSFGRDLIPEFVNRTHTYFQQCLDMLYFYNDNATKRFLHGDLSIHLNKLNGIIRSFCRTVTEYRKSVLDQVKMELAKGMTEVVTAQMLGTGRMSTAEIFKALREARGPTEV